jgi:endonuclease/exonuclease/phosphatase family metal-dependent hydrolase
MDDKTRQKKLSLVTFNTLGVPFFAPNITKRYKKIAQLINDSDYDIVCLQELFSYYHLFLFKNNLKKFPNVAYQKNLLGPRGGLAIFSKLQLNNPDFHTYSIPKNARFPFHTKLVQNGVLSSIIEPFSIRICTTHLTSDIEHNLTPKNDYYNLIKAQSIEAANVFNNYAKSGQPIIMTGDFNIAKHSLLYKEFLETTHANDVFEKDETATYYNERLGFYFKALASNRIDYIFYKTKNIVPLTIENIFIEEVAIRKHKKTYLSDHIGLHCTLSVNE